MKIQQELFFGPIFCASLYSALHNTPVAPALAGEMDLLKKISMALEEFLGEKASGLSITQITYGKARMELLEHVRKIEQLLQGQFEFVMDHPANRQNFYLPTGQPGGYYIEGLRPEDEKILNNLFLQQYLIISSSEMKALGFDDSSPQGVVKVLNEIIPMEGYIILTGKKGNVCVVAESEKLQQLKKALPLPVLVSPAQAIAILYHADLREQKNSESISESLEKVQPNPDILSDALEKLSIRCYVELSDSKSIRILALPKEHDRIYKIWDKCLQGFNISLRQNLNIEIEQFANSVTSRSIAQWFGHNNFVYLPEAAIIVRDKSSLQKLRDLRSEWVEINIVYLKLLGLFFKNPYGTMDKKICIYLKVKKIIPQNLSIDVLERSDRIIKISIPVKYKEEVLNHLATLFSDHSVEVTPGIVEIFHQQTGTKELQKALTRLQKEERVERGLIVQKDQKNYIIFANKIDVERFKFSWVRRPVSINPLQRMAIKLKAKSKGCKDHDFKSCCNFLKIIAEHPSNYFNFSCRGVQPEIKMDFENLQNLNRLIDSFVLIPPEVYNFISGYLSDISDYCQGVNNNQYYLISKNEVASVYSDRIPGIYNSIPSENMMMYPYVVGDDKGCNIEELDKDTMRIFFTQLEGCIAEWKQQTGYKPLTYQVLEPVEIKFSSEQAEYLKKPRSSSITHNLFTSNQEFMGSRRNSSLFQPYNPVDLRDSKRGSGSYHTPGISLFATPVSSKGSSPVGSPASSLLPSPGSSPSSSPNSSPGFYSRSIFNPVGSDCELYNIDIGSSLT